MNHDLLERLAARLAQPLAGPLVGSRFEPKPRLDRHYNRVPPGARQAAVLILFYPREGQWTVPLTLRPSHLPDHAGQICLPGGALEAEESGRDAAVREFHEELGAEGHAIQLIGRLSTLYVNASNFAIEPWVGFTDRRPAMVPDAREVEALLEVPLAHLLDPESLGWQTRMYQGTPYTAPHFLWQTHCIWGATCMILGELVTLLEEIDVGGELLPRHSQHDN